MLCTFQEFPEFASILFSVDRMLHIFKFEGHSIFKFMVLPQQKAASMLDLGFCCARLLCFGNTCLGCGFIVGFDVSNNIKLQKCAAFGMHMLLLPAHLTEQWGHWTGRL